MTHNRLSLSVLALGTGLVLSLGFTACGGSDDDGGASAQSAATSDNPVQEQQAVRKAMEKLEDDLYSADVKAYCDGLTEKAKDEKEGGKTCEESLGELVGKPLSQTAREMYKTRVLRVEVHGDKAILKTREADNESKDIPFVKVDGRWMLDRADSK